MDAVLATRTQDDWIARFDAAGVPVGPVNTIGEALAHPQTLARGMVVDLVHPQAGPTKALGCPIHFSETPTARHAPGADARRAHARSVARARLCGRRHRCVRRRRRRRGRGPRLKRTLKCDVRPAFLPASTHRRRRCRRDARRRRGVPSRRRARRHSARAAISLNAVKLGLAENSISALATLEVTARTSRFTPVCSRIVFAATSGQ